MTRIGNYSSMDGASKCYADIAIGLIASAVDGILVADRASPASRSII